jgi:hypothetical protein
MGKKQGYHQNRQDTISRAKGVGDVVQAGDHLSSKLEVLSSIPSIAKNTKEIMYKREI